MNNLIKRSILGTVPNGGKLYIPISLDVFGITSQDGFLRTWPSDQNIEGSPVVAYNVTINRGKVTIIEKPIQGFQTGAVFSIYF